MTRPLRFSGSGGLAIGAGVAAGFGTGAGVAAGFGASAAGLVVGAGAGAAAGFGAAPCAVDRTAPPIRLAAIAIERPITVLAYNF